MSEMRDTRNDRMEDPAYRSDVPEPDRETMDRERAMDRETQAERDARVDRDATMQRDTMVEREPVRSKSGQVTQMEMWPDMGDLRHRFDAIQAEFIDDPQRAVHDAESLINDVVERITRSMHERIESMHRETEGRNDTEQLRQTMRGYRDLVVWMETRRAA